MILAFFQEFLLLWKLHVLAIGRIVPTHWSTGQSGDVILIQGFNESWFALKQIGEKLNQHGYRIHVVPKLRRNRMRLRKAVVILAEFIQLKQLKNVIIVAHSKGGLVAKLYLDSLAGQHHISKVISIATPYQGTILGYLAHSFLHELRPNSPQIVAVLNDQRHLKQIENLYAAVDSEIIITGNAILPGANNHKINIFGHTRILFALQTWQVIKKVLAISS